MAFSLLVVDVEVSLWVSVGIVFCVGDVSCADKLLHVFFWDVVKFINEVNVGPVDIANCSN